MKLDYNKYPFIKCLHPQTIINPYTKQPMVVSCGHCKACNLRKSSRMTFLCSREESISKYVYFITLTYSNDFVPKFMVNFNQDNNQYDFVSVCKRYNDYEETPLIGSLPYSDYPSYKMSALQNKVNLNGFIPFAYFRDVQLYLKRLRKQFSKYEKEEKIKFYIVSEYGPKTFRPHFHVLIFNQSDRIHSHWSKVVSKAWSYGRVDSSLSRGKCSGYLASYLNSTCSLPSVYRVGSIKPKSTHSRFFGCGFSKEQYSDLYELPLNKVVTISSSINGKIISTPLPVALQATLFPRCKSFASKSFIERYRSYTIITRFKRYKYALNYSGAEDIAHELLQHRSNEVLNYFYDSIQINKFPLTELDILDFVGTPDYDRLVDSIYREMLLSLHFVRDICNFNPNLYMSRVKHICDYYSYKESLALHDFYKLQKDYLDSGLYPFGVCHFYDNFFDYDIQSGVLHKKLSRHALKLFADLGGLESDTPFDEKLDIRFHPLYKDFSFYVEQRSEQKIKHKILNDLNKIFL